MDVFERVDAGADVEGLQAAVLAQQDVRAAPAKGLGKTVRIS